MTADLDLTDNSEARFAYNSANGDPWHRMGMAVAGYGTIDEMLFASHTAHEVVGVPVYVQNADGTYQQVETHQATVRNRDSFGADGFTTETDILGVVGNGYVIEQNRDAAQFALDLVGATVDQACVDTMGNLKGGRQFFTLVAMEPLVLDPNGIADVVKKYVAVVNAHDGSASITAFPTNIRVVCSNTLAASLGAAKKADEVYRVRHSSGKDDYKAQAVQAMGVARQMEELFVSQANQLIALPGGHDVLDDTIKAIWAKPTLDADQTTSRKLTNWSDRRNELHKLYESPTNAGGFGDSAWTVFNTIGEFADHHRARSDADSRAMASLDPSSDVTKAKDTAARVLLGV